MKLIELNPKEWFNFKALVHPNKYEIIQILKGSVFIQADITLLTALGF